VRATAAEETQSGAIVLLCLAAWAVPGLGHLWLGRRRKGLVFLVALPLMFAIGLSAHGRLSTFDWSDPFACLVAIAQAGTGAMYFIGRGLGYIYGDVTAVTFEYANTFLMVAGLLNMLVIVDVFDIAMGRK
jgi:hypothetical protein